MDGLMKRLYRKHKKLGFAESDPTADVDGLDAARKVAILANLGFFDECFIR